MMFRIYEQTRGVETRFMVEASFDGDTWHDPKSGLLLGRQAVFDELDDAIRMVEDFEPWTSTYVVYMVNYGEADGDVS